MLRLATKIDDRSQVKAKLKIKLMKTIKICRANFRRYRAAFTSYSRKIITQESILKFCPANNPSFFLSRGVNRGFPVSEISVSFKISHNKTCRIFFVKFSKSVRLTLKIAPYALIAVIIIVISMNLHSRPQDIVGQMLGRRRRRFQ